MSTSRSQFGLACLVAVLACVPAFAETKDEKKKLSATKIAVRTKKKIKEGEPDVVSRLLSYDEVLEALERAPDSARAVAHTVCDKARDIGVKWRGDQPTMRKLTEGLQKMAERTLRLHPKSASAESTMACALAATGRIFEAMGSSQPFNTWERAANHATRAADLEEDKRHEHLLRATRFLREGAPLANQRELLVLRQALGYIAEARKDRQDDGELRREHAYVHLAIAAFSMRTQKEPQARKAYNDALDLVELPKDEKPKRADKNAYNRVVAFGQQHGFVRAGEGFIGKSTGELSPWWMLSYPEASGWKFATAMDALAIIRMTKHRVTGGRIEIVIRRYRARRGIVFGPTKVGGGNVSGISKWRMSIARQEYKQSNEATIAKKGLPQPLQKAKSWALVGDMAGEPTRMHGFFFRGKESPCSYGLEVIEHGVWPEDMDSEVLYILKSLQEREQKK